MGGSSWSDSHYASRSSVRAASGSDGFDYSKKIRSGSIKAAVNEKLDPKKMKNGKRECRDSEAHPNSVPVYVGLDVTGSMQTVPTIIQKKLPELMGLLIRKGYLEHPSICMSAIGDAYYDRVPFQVGQFESGIEIDDDITNIYMEGGGGGNDFESYELVLYFLARCVEADHFTRGKGYAFIICDESLHGKVSKDEVEEVFGHKIQSDINVVDLIQEVKEKWNIYCIVPKMTSHYANHEMKKFWKEQLGQNVLLLEDPEGIVELIASTIGFNEGGDLDNIINDLTEVSTERIALSVSKSLATVDKGISTKGTGLATL